MYEIEKILVGRWVCEGTVRVGERRLSWVVRSCGVWRSGWDVGFDVSLEGDEVRYVVWLAVVPWMIVLSI